MLDLQLKNNGEKKMTKIKAGSIIKFGNINWLVLEVQGDRALIITKDVMEPRQYDDNDDDQTWETCALRKYLNNDFFDRFSYDEKNMIIGTDIINNDNLWYNTSGGYSTFDKIFLLSIDEAEKYFGGSADYVNKNRKNFKGVNDNSGAYLSNSNDKKRAAKFGGKLSALWWLRSPGSNSNKAAKVAANGSILVIGEKFSEMAPFRPALWLKV